MPVDVVGIATSSDIKLVRNSDVDILKTPESGKTFFNGKKWIIVYDDTKTVEESRYTVAHELAHIFLGHELSAIGGSEIKEFIQNKSNEKQADSFAVRILCPACVIKGLNILEAEDIARACRVAPALAKKRAKRMKILLERDKFFTSAMEERVYMNFSEYIQDKLWEREFL